MSSAAFIPDDLIRCLQIGVMEAWCQAKDFTEDLSAEVWPEYLVTVSLARCFCENRRDWHRIEMEVATNDLVTRALLGRTPEEPLSREGRVDLVLCRQGLNQPAYLVEAKDAVINYLEAVDDIIRLEQFLRLRGGGKVSSVKMGALVLLVRKKNTRIFADVLQRAAASSISNICKKLEAYLSHPAEIGVKWSMREVSNTAKERIPTAEDLAEEGGPTVHGDEHLTVALIGVLYRKADYP